MGFTRHPTQYSTCDAAEERPPGDEEALRRLTVRLQTEASNEALMYSHALQVKDACFKNASKIWLKGMQCQGSLQRHIKRDCDRNVIYIPCQGECVLW